MKKLLLLLMFATFATGLKAQMMLRVLTESWEDCRDIQLADINAISFSDGNMTVERLTTQNVVVPLSRIEQLRFAMAVSVAPALGEGAATLAYNRQGETLRVDGVNEGSRLAIYGANGALYVNIPSYTNEDIDVSALNHGIYIVTIEGHNFKFAK